MLSFVRRIALMLSVLACLAAMLPGSGFAGTERSRLDRPAGHSHAVIQRCQHGHRDGEGCASTSDAEVAESVSDEREQSAEIHFLGLRASNGTVEFPRLLPLDRRPAGDEIPFTLQFVFGRYFSLPPPRLA